MGPVRASGSESTVMFNYSQDYPFERTEGLDAPGLGLLPPVAPSNCPTSYAAAGAATDKHRVHRWVTAPMATGFVSTAESSLTYWTRTVDALSGTGKICVSLHRLDGSGAIVGSALTVPAPSHELSAWPLEASQLQFRFAHSAFTIPAGQRLMLTLSLSNTTLPGGIELLYDHPQYDTVLSVGTTTPIA